MRLYAEISKRDEEQRMVWGYASTESQDSQGEVIKSDAIAAALDDYMKFGNIRVMHQPIAVGVAKEAEMTEKGLFIGAKIVDNDAWEKVKEGVYKGFSIGGSCTGRDSVNKKVITGVRLTEISLVDRPANPDAIFEIWKGDGMDMSKEQAVEILAEMLTKGEVDPIEIVKAAKAGKISELSEEVSEDLANGEVDPDVAAIAEMLNKGDVLPSELLELAKGCKEKKVEKEEKEDDEMEELKEDPAHEAKESPAEERAEHGSESEGESKEGEEESEESEKEEKAKKSDESDDLRKADVDFESLLKGELSKVEEKHAEEVKKFEGVVSGLQEVLEKMEKRMKELEALPVPAKGALMSVSKGADSGSAAEDDAEDAASAIRKLHKSGGINFR